MEIKIDQYNYTEDGKVFSIGHYTLTEDDIIHIMEQRHSNEETSYPINLDRDKCKVEFIVDSVTV